MALFWCRGGGTRGTAAVEGGGRRPSQTSLGPEDDDWWAADGVWEFWPSRTGPVVFKHNSKLPSTRRSRKLFKPVPPTTSIKAGLVGGLNNVGKVGQEGRGGEVKEPSMRRLPYLSDSRRLLLCTEERRTQGIKRPSEEMSRPHSYSLHLAQGKAGCLR